VSTRTEPDEPKISMPSAGRPGTSTVIEMVPDRARHGCHDRRPGLVTTEVTVTRVNRLDLTEQIANGVVDVCAVRRQQISRSIGLES
jgi:hypothetical protein